MFSPQWRPDLSSPEVRNKLEPRGAPYFSLISYCRHIGLLKRDSVYSHWVARVRKRDGVLQYPLPDFVSCYTSRFRRYQT